MSKKDEAIKERLAELDKEKGCFSYVDFCSPTYTGKAFFMKRGTFKNKVMALRHQKIIERLCIKDRVPIYVLTGKKSRRPMMVWGTGVPSITESAEPIYGFAMGLPMANFAIHDIRLRFYSKGIWKLYSDYFISESLHGKIEPGNKNIQLMIYQLGESKVSAAVHHNDSVSIIIKCSAKPLNIDIHGISALVEMLCFSEHFFKSSVESLQNDMMKKQYERSDIPSPDIPYYRTWVVTQWHFGRDSITECSGFDFHVNWSEAENQLARAYTKSLDEGKHILREEIEQAPENRIFNAIEEKINLIHPIFLKELFENPN